MSLIDQLIKNEIKAIKKDIDTLSEEILQLETQTFDKSDLMYSSKAGKYQIARAKLITLSSVRGYLEEEVALYEEAFSEELLKNINYILEEYSIEPLPIIIEKIIDARLDIVRFVKSGISENDYDRDMITFEKKINDIEKLAVAYPTLLIPKLPHESIKYLIYELNAYRGIAVDGNKPVIDDEAIKTLVTIITDKKRLPKGHDDFSRELNLKTGWL